LPKPEKRFILIYPEFTLKAVITGKILPGFKISHEPIIIFKF